MIITNARLHSLKPKLRFYKGSNLVYGVPEVCNHHKQPSKGILRKRCSENMQKIYRRSPIHPCQSVISVKLLCNLIEITIWHGCSLFQIIFSKEHLWRNVSECREPAAMVLARIMTKNLSWFSHSTETSSHLHYHQKQWKNSIVNNFTHVTFLIFSMQVNTVTWK